MVIESAYCHSPHRDRARQVGDFVSAVEEVVSGGGGRQAGADVWRTASGTTLATPGWTEAVPRAT